MGTWWATGLLCFPRLGSIKITGVFDQGGFVQRPLTTFNQLGTHGVRRPQRVHSRVGGQVWHLFLGQNCVLALQIPWGCPWVGQQLFVAPPSQFTPPSTVRSLTFGGFR